MRVGTSTVADIDNITVYLVYDADGIIDDPFTPPSADNNTCAILRWVKGAGTPFSLDSAHSGSTWGLTGTEADNMTASVGDWVFHVTVSKVAKQSTDNATTEWHIHAYANDGTTEAYKASADNSEVAWYGEIGDVTTTVKWAAALGVGSDNIQSPQFGATYKCNGTFNQQVMASESWTGPATLTLNTSGTPGNAQLSLMADVDSDISGATQVTTSYKTMHSGVMTPESGDKESNLFLWLSLGDTGIPAGEYSGSVYLKISNS